MIMKNESQAFYSQHNTLLPEHFSASFCRNSVIAEMEFLRRTRENQYFFGNVWAILNQNAE